MICCLPTVAHPSPRLENTDFYWLFDNSIQNLPTFSSRISSVPNSGQTSFCPLFFLSSPPTNFSPISELIGKYPPLFGGIHFRDGEELAQK